NIRSSDIVVIIGGRSGTLGELAIAYDEGKLIGVLTGTGGISDLVADILVACQKDTGAQVVYDTVPQRLVKKLVRAYRTSHFRRPSCFCQDGPPGEEVAPTADTERDPVCGMRLNKSSAAAQAAYWGQTFYFCTDRCRRKFGAAPDHYRIPAP